MFDEAIEMIEKLAFSDFFGSVKLKIDTTTKIKIIKKFIEKSPDTPMSTHLLLMRKHCESYKEKVLINRLIRMHFRSLTKDYKERNLKTIINELETTIGDGKIIKEKLNRQWKNQQKI